MSIINKARRFAYKKHSGQKYNGKPYIIHPELVYQLLVKVTPMDFNLLCAAYLHDTLEDTNTTYEELLTTFNEDIAKLVYEVTKDKNKNFPNLKTERGLVLKVADRLANVSSFAANQDKMKRKKLFKKYSHCFINEGTHRNG